LIKKRRLLQNLIDNKILIINDSHSLNALLKLTLEKEGFSVVYIETGLEGIEEAKTWQYRLILLDYVLPDISGLEVCKKLREEESTKHIPIAFITGKTEEEISEKIINAGADSYIEPPFKGEDFIDRINELIVYWHR